MKNKLVALVALVGGVVVVSSLAWMMHGNSDPALADSSTPPPANSVEASDDDSLSPPDTVRPDSSHSVADKPSIAPSEMELTLQEAWERERGYMSAERMNLRSLDEAQLQELIAQGNTAAITTLASRYLTTDPQKMMDLYQQAAVLGNTSALVSASSAWASPSISASVATMRVSENPPVNMLAMLLVAQLRGDNVLVPQQLQQLEADYDFTEEMIAEACTGAVRVYEELEAKRLALGQNYFDNTPSPLGQKYEEGNHTSATCGKQ